MQKLGPTKKKSQPHFLRDNIITKKPLFLDGSRPQKSNFFAAAFFSYVAINMSMVLGLLPIVGAPLPIMSYGGSAMLSMMIGLGIVMSCRIYRTS